MIEYTVKVVGGIQHWFLNDKLHREDGPAVEFADGCKLWYLNGVNLTEAEFNTRTKAKELTINEIEQLLGFKIKIVGNACQPLNP